MTTKKSTKGKGFGTIKKVRSVANDDQEPLTNFQKAADDELEDPALFEEMNQVRIPKLERVGKRFLEQKDLAKREAEKRDGLDEECQIIMADHEIESYRTPTLKLRLKRGKTHVDGELN